jgi:hypothetical protein
MDTQRIVTSARDATTPSPGSLWSTRVREGVVIPGAKIGANPEKVESPDSTFDDVFASKERGERFYAKWRHSKAFSGKSKT